MRRLAHAWFPVAAWCAALFWLSSRPGDDVSPFLPPLPHADKLVHALAYGAGGLLARRAWRLHPRLSPGKATFAAIVFATGYGLTDELHQALGAAGRHADPLDLAADAAGAIVACVLAHLYERRRDAGRQAS